MPYGTDPSSFGTFGFSCVFEIAKQGADLNSATIRYQHAAV